MSRKTKVKVPAEVVGVPVTVVSYDFSDNPYDDTMQITLRAVINKPDLNNDDWDTMKDVTRLGKGVIVVGE